MHLSSCMSSQADGCQHRMTHNFQPVISTEPSDIGDKASENVDGEKANMDLPELTVHQSGSDIFSTIQWNSHFCYLKSISFSTIPNYLQESFCDSQTTSFLEILAQYTALIKLYKD